MVVAFSIGLGSPAHADGRGGASAGQSHFTAAAGNASNGGGVPVPPVTTAGSDSGTWFHEGVCSFGGLATCAEYLRCPDGSIVIHWWYAVDGVTQTDSYVCPTEGTVVEPPQITNAMVARAFRRIPLPESRLVVQPPGGETLVNFATNFYTVAEPFERSVRLVGQRVDLRIWPSSFGWDFGDGAVSSTSGPGAAYPDLQVTHEYVAAVRVAPSVDTTYSAEFRVNGGAWEPVVGTVTMAGDPVGLRVRTATPTLVGYH